MNNPMLQFFQGVIFPIKVWGYDISITTGVLFMLLSTVLVVFFCWGLRKRELRPGYWQTLVEQTILLLWEMIGCKKQKNTQRILPVVASLFLVVMFGNLVGLVPGSYTFTSQIIVTGTLSLVIFALSIIWGLQTQGVAFFKHFIPKGCSVWLYPLLIPIEVISFFTRPISLGLRLFVNMVAGHSIVAVFASFAVSFGVVSIAVGILNTVLFVLEFGVAIIQAYVFAILSSLYLKEGLHEV